jgi:hypothetical protein
MAPEIGFKAEGIDFIDPEEASTVSFECLE